MFVIRGSIKAVPKQKNQSVTFVLTGKTWNELKNRHYHFNSHIAIPVDDFNENFAHFAEGNSIALTLESQWDTGKDSLPYKFVSVADSKTNFNNPITKVGFVERIRREKVKDDILISFILHCDEEAYKCFAFESDIEKNEVDLTDDLTAGEWEFKLIPRDLHRYDEEGKILDPLTPHDRVFKFEIQSGMLLELSNGEEDIKEDERENDEENDFDDLIKDLVDEDYINSFNPDSEGENNMSQAYNRDTAWIDEMDAILTMLYRHLEEVKDDEIKSLIRETIKEKLKKLAIRDGKD